MKKLLVVFMALLTGAPLLAQSPDTGHLAIIYDLDSNSFVYPVTRGQGGSPFGGGIEGPGTLTAATSVTVDGTTGAFTDLAADDIIQVTKPDGTTDIVAIVTRTSSIQVVVDTAVTWAAGTKWRYFKVSAGTADTDGWIDVSGFSGGGNITVEYNQGDFVTALEVRWEAKGPGIGALPVIIYPGDSSDCGGGVLASGVCQFATAGIASRNSLIFTGEESWGAVRVGIRRNGNDTSDATTNRERINISVSGRKAR